MGPARLAEQRNLPKGMTRRQFIRLALEGLGLAGGTVLLAACGAEPTSPATVDPTPVATQPQEHPLVLPGTAPGQLASVLPNSDLAAGPNRRFLLALFDDRSQPVPDAQVQLRFFKKLEQGKAQLRSEAAATFFTSPRFGNRGLYVARTAFDEPGPWGVEVQATRPGGTAQTLRLDFEVRAQSRTPAIGSPAPTARR
ncbi:MAG: hypothetical protein HY689_13655 [Chloroflexi bacterium]|nr:hypothetical protein [Chloroflexota bacterium]